MAPVVTPLLVLLIAGQTVDVAVWDMFISIVQVVLVPIAAGFIINKLFEKFAKRIFSCASSDFRNRYFIDHLWQ